MLRSCIALVLLLVAVSTATAQQKDATRQTVPDKRGTPEAPLAIRILPADDAKDKAAAEKAENDRKAASDAALVDETSKLVAETSKLGGATMLLAVIAAGQASFFIWQLMLMSSGLRDSREAARAAKRSADTAREALTKLQRAFIVSKGMNNSRRVVVDAAGTVRWILQHDWENVGNSMAKNSVAHVSWTGPDQVAPLPDDFAFPDLGDQGQKVLPLGPKVTVQSGGPIDLSTEEMTTIRDGRRFFYVWGWTTYEDIFGSKHTTKFCYELKKVIGDLAAGVDEREKKIGMVWELYRAHNEAD